MWTSVWMQVKVQMLEQQLADAQEAATSTRPMRLDDAELQKCREDIENALAMNQKLEEELSKRDELIERLHQENEKLFERLTERRMSASSPRVSASPKVGFSTFPMCRKTEYAGWWLQWPMSTVAI
jgi:predicted nuclease with TOPRIM domain